MKVDEVTYKIQIDESIKFSPAVKKQTQSGVVWDPFEFAEKEEVTCTRCEGSGCSHCKGTGKHVDMTMFAPELEVGEETAKILQKLLGVAKIDIVGVIESEELPNVLSRLNKLKYFSNVKNHTTNDQIEYVIDQLIKMIEFAKDNGAGISWS
jgi:hypothetical protein